MARSLLLLAIPLAVAAEEDRLPAHAGHILEEVVVIGARRGDRTNVDTPAPVYVIGESALRDQGNTDLLDALRTVVPSFSVNAQPIADGATIVRPPNLRNLAADHTLVLVNGKRRHRGAVIGWLVPKASEGAQGPDLSVIPAIALERVEVLRDGAAAQYGSDAIAGVINFVLKDDRDGGSVELRAGVTAEGDGARRSVAANAGFPLGDGFVNLSVEYGDADATSRSVQRDDAAALIAAGNARVPVPAQVWGSPIVRDDLKTFVNAGLPLGDRVEAFAFGNFASKHTDGGFYYRNPHDRQGVYTNGPYRLVGDLTPDGSGDCPRDLPADRFVENGAFDTAAFRAAHPQCFVTNELFPGGFTPRFGGDTRDWSVVAGLRGALAALDWELTAGAGVNDVDFFIRNTVNAALGPHNPADFRFDPGAYAQEERSVQLDFAYERGFARLASPLHIAFGAEWRRESFEIEAGERASWINVIEGGDGPVDLQVQGFSAATNGFPGFSPDTAGRWQRSSHAAYVELDADVLPGWTVVAALRGERYADFGSTVNGKLSTRYALGDDWAVRATWSSGFRAPTPGQSNAVNATSKQAGQGAERVLAVVATIPSTSPVGESLGGRALEPEVSRDVSAGLTYGGVDTHASLDCFRILVRDRLALSRDIEINRPDLGRVRDAELRALEAAGWSSARSWNYINYFTNDFTTRTRGCELSGQLRLEPGNGVTSLRAGLARTLTEVVRFTPGGPLDDPYEIRDYERGLPRDRLVLTAYHTVGAWDLLARYWHTAAWYDSEERLDFDGYGLFDVAVGYTRGGWSVRIGADNAFDTYPDPNPNARSGLGNRYSQYAPAGFNGRFAYVHLGKSF